MENDYVKIRILEKQDAVIGKGDILSCLERAVEEQALPELPGQKDCRTRD